MRLTLFILITTLSLTGCDNKSERFKACDNQQFESSQEYMECKYPHPPIGRWHAVYTKEFAEKYDLPLENVSTDFSKGVDYMEMEVLPYGKGGVACLVNMLVKKPHDIALYTDGKELEKLPDDRKLLHLIDLNQYRDQQKTLRSFWSASRNYKTEKSGYSGTTFGSYVEDVLPGYDYFSANKKCRDISIHPRSYFPENYAFWIAKASIWGLYERNYKSIDQPGRPKGQDFYDSHFFVNIPKEIISEVFKDVPTGGQ